MEYANVAFHAECAVQGVLSRGARVEGVRYRENGEMRTLAADLVVDATLTRHRLFSRQIDLNLGLALHNLTAGRP
jgi:hypothetical protein